MSTATTKEGAHERALAFFKDRFSVDQAGIEAALDSALERGFDVGLAPLHALE